jgi:hypothetical protein
MFSPLLKRNNVGAFEAYAVVIFTINRFPQSRISNEIYEYSQSLHIPRIELTLFSKRAANDVKEGEK